MSTMNTSHHPNDPEGNEREYAPLETQLSSYFGAQPDEPLPVDAFWSLLAPHLEMRAGAEQTSATVTDTVQPDRAVATRHIADDIAGAIPIAHPIPAPRPRRFAHVITNIAAIGRWLRYVWRPLPSSTLRGWALRGSEGRPSL